MQTQFNYFTLLFLCLLGSSCCRQADLTIQPALAAWQPYTGSEKLIFTNETGSDTISFTTSVRQFNQQAHDKVCGAYNVETEEAKLKFTADTSFQVRTQISHEAVLSIQVTNKQPAGSNLYVQYNGISDQFISDSWRDRLKTGETVNGVIYPQLLHVYGNQISGILSFSDLLYAKNKGLVGFKLFDGDWYFLKQ